jgi:hypothetical protein
MKNDRFESSHEPESESWYHIAKDKTEEFIRTN